MTSGTGVIVRRGARVSCRCFGPSSSLLGARHIVRDGILLAIALVGALGTSRGTASPAGIAVSLVAALFGATLAVFSDDLFALFESDPAARASESPQ